MSYLHLYYRSYKSGKRTIYAPCKALKEIQKTFLKTIKLFYNLNLSIQKTADVHTNKKWLLKMDIKNFYDSVTEEQIKACIKTVFERLKYPYDSKRLKTTFDYCTYNGKLPTGAVTSPHLANMVLLDFDKFITLYCKRNNIGFSRYVDDLFFSSDNKEDLKKIEHLVECLLNKNHFNLNPDKTKYISHNKRQEVLGMVVNNDCAKLSKDTKRQYRAMFHNYIKSIYLEENFDISALSLREYDFNKINGYLAYINCCDKEYYKTMKKYIKKLLKKYKIDDENEEIEALKKVIK